MRPQAKVFLLSYSLHPPGCPQAQNWNVKEKRTNIFREAGFRKWKLTWERRMSYFILPASCDSRHTSRRNLIVLDASHIVQVRFVSNTQETEQEQQTSNFCAFHCSAPSVKSVWMSLCLNLGTSTALPVSLEITLRRLYFASVCLGWLGT